MQQLMMILSTFVLAAALLSMMSSTTSVRQVSAAVLVDSWELLVENAGVSAMHMTLAHTNKVIMFDRTDYGPSEIKLANGYCRHDPQDLALQVDCWAHSIELDLATNVIRPLTVLTDTWCSSGAWQADGFLTQTGGWNDGGSNVRTIGGGPDDDWVEYRNALAESRWYATNQLLPDQRQIVIGGRRQFNYEFVPPPAAAGGKYSYLAGRATAINFPFLAQTNDNEAENNLYPFVHLSTDGNLFVFANKDSILLNYNTGETVRTFPTLAGGPRNYPSSGSSVLLPISAADGYTTAEVLVCGGSSDGAYVEATKRKQYWAAEQTCARLVITDPNPTWVIFDMPSPRVMGDMLLLPTGEVLIINGATQGTAGWGNAREPNLNPILFTPVNNRFQVMTPSTIPRVYHSTAVLLADGSVLVGGSNPNFGYTFTNTLFPTELRIERYSPYYLHSGYDLRRPYIDTISELALGYATSFTVLYHLGETADGVSFHLYAPPFTTHTFSMNQRLLVLGSSQTPVLQKQAFLPGGSNYVYLSTVYAPPTSVTAPAGYYLLTVVNQGTPSASAWVHIG